MEKIFVLDTNVLLHDPRSLFSFQDNNVVLPFSVIEEVDDKKTLMNEVGRNAREVSRILDGMRSRGKLAKGIKLDNGGLLRVELNHQNMIDHPDGLNPEKCDNRILAVAYNLQKNNPDARVALVTKDINLRIKADVVGVRAENYQSDKVDVDQLYSGFREVRATAEEIIKLYDQKSIEADPSLKLFPNEFVILRESGGASSAIGRNNGGKIIIVNSDGKKVFGVRPKNKEQRFAFELLLDGRVKIITIIGQAGTGKTLLAIAAGLEQVVEKSVYGKLLVTRPVIPVGKGLGFLPGDIDDKLRPWMQPVYDSFGYIFGTGEKASKDIRRGDKRESDLDFTINMLKEDGKIEVGALSFVRGRSIPNQFIVCDDAQNLTPLEVKTMVTRVGEGSVIVFTGDPCQIDHPYLDSSSNGLTYLVERMKGEDLFGHVTLTKCERSEVAEAGSRRL